MVRFCYYFIYMTDTMIPWVFYLSGAIFKLCRLCHLYSYGLVFQSEYCRLSILSRQRNLNKNLFAIHFFLTIHTKNFFISLCRINFFSIKKSYNCTQFRLKIEFLPFFHNFLVVFTHLLCIVYSASQFCLPPPPLLLKPLYPLGW